MILSCGKGKNKRQWELDEEEFGRFEFMFEECELVDMSEFDLSNIKLTLVEPPKRK